MLLEAYVEIVRLTTAHVQRQTCRYLYVGDPSFVGSQFKRQKLINFKVSHLGSENVYTQSQHVKI